MLRLPFDTAYTVILKDINQFTTFEAKQCSIISQEYIALSFELVPRDNVGINELSYIPQKLKKTKTPKHTSHKSTDQDGDKTILAMATTMNKRLPTYSADQR